MILFIIGLRQNPATSRLNNVSNKIIMLYDNKSIYEILFVSWCLWCKHKVCHTKQTYIIKITAKVKVILLASRKSKYLLRNQGVNEVLTHRLTRVHIPHTNTHTCKHTQNIT